MNKKKDLSRNGPTINKSKEILFAIPILFISIFFFAINDSIAISKMISIWILLLNGYCLLRSRSNWKMTIIYFFILWSNYSIFMANLYAGFDTFFTGWKNINEIIIPSINILLFFSTILAIFTPLITPKKNDTILENNKNNSLIVYASIIVLIIILILGFTRPEAIGERGSPSTIYEYSIIIFIIAIFYSNKRPERIALVVTALLYIFQNLLYGGRVTALQYTITLFIIFLSQKVKIKQVIPFAIIGMIILSGIGMDRASYNIDSETIHKTTQHILEKGATLDTAYSAYYTSGTFIKVRSSTEQDERISLFGKYLLSIILGGKVEDSNLAAYTRKNYMHYSGGILPFFPYFYFGYIGTIMLSFYLIILMYTSMNGKTNLSRCISIYIAGTVPRWYLYSQTPIMRGILLFAIIYCIFFIINNLTNKNTKESKSQV